MELLYTALQFFVRLKLHKKSRVQKLKYKKMVFNPSHAQSSFLLERMNQAEDSQTKADRKGKGQTHKGQDPSGSLTFSR